MKTKHLLACLAATLMLLSAEMSLSGQNILYDLPGIDVRNSIIRYFDADDSYVIYTDDGASRKFVYFNPSTNTAVSAAFTSADVLVNDMEIVRRTLYFCGKKASSNEAAFGLFDIPSVFLSSGPIKVSYPAGYTAINVSGTPVTEYLTNFLQIEVQVLADNDIHIYMIADAYNTDQSGTVSNDYRCVVDVYEDGNGMACSHEHFTGVYYFNDLVMTDKDLVVVGDKRGGTAQYMHKYTLPTAGTPSIFTALPLYFSYWFSNAAQYHPIPEVRLAHISDSVFAVACRGVVQLSHTGIVVSVYGGTGNLLDRILIDDPYDTRQIRDLEYNKKENRLYLVPEHSQTNKRNSQYVIDLTPTFAMTAVSMLTPSFDEVHSLVLNGYETELSGMDNNILWVWRTDVASSHCAAKDNIPFRHYWFPEVEAPSQKTVAPWKYAYRVFPPIIRHEQISIKCE